MVPENSIYAKKNDLNIDQIDGFVFGGLLSNEVKKMRRVLTNQFLLWP